MSTPALDSLRELPMSERRSTLEELVVTDFKSVLYMTDEEDFPADESFFDLGLTSLRLTEIKERLEALLGRAIDANSLFNSPTLESLLRHLTDEVLPDLFHSPAESAHAAPARAEPARAEIEDLLSDLYRA